MSHRVLALKYRPQTLQQLIGQDTLVQSLRQSFISNRIPHAILLHGVRGVGKTTTARIIAKCLNCLGVNGDHKELTPDPCGECISCTSIQNDRHMDVIEIDAASRTGVDDVREIIDSIPYKALQGRFKVFIIDEVHMLSKSAFNALLKTLEEPPTHVKFILATTEIRKIPETILSRCMRFDLRKITIKKIVEYLKIIIGQENIEITDDALILIAKAADGSMRDALSLLDQAIIFNNDKVQVKADCIKEMLGLADKSQLFSIIESILNGQPELVLKSTKNLWEGGGDALLILQDLLDIVHWLTCLKTNPQLGNNQLLPGLEGEKIIHSIQPSILMQIWQIMLSGYEEVNQSPLPNQSLEMLLLRACYIKDLTPLSDLLNINAESIQNNSQIPKLQESVLPNTFQNMLVLLKDKKEMLLFDQLSRFVHLIDYKPGLITFRLKDNAPSQIAQRWQKTLEMYTGITWIFSQSKAEGDQTIWDQTKINTLKLQNQALNHPYVLSLKESFPDAQVSLTSD